MEERPMFYANEVDSELTPWTVLIQVIERRKARKNDGGPWFRNYMVTDMRGTMVPLVCFGKQVSHFANTLLPFKRYKLSNATVKETPLAYKLVPYPYTWTLHRKVLIEPHEDDVPYPLPCTFSFDKFSDFYRFADQERPMCIKALVIDAMHVQETPDGLSRDYVVIDEEMIPTLLRVWDGLLEDVNVNLYAKHKIPTLLIAYGLKVTTFNCISLGIKGNVYFAHDPPLNEEFPLKEWYVANSDKIKHLLDTGACRDPNVLFRPPRRSEIISLEHALATLPNVKTVWTEGQVTYYPLQDKLWFEACEKCLTPLSVGDPWKIHCSTCQKMSNVVIWGDIIVYLRNGDTVIQATIKSPEMDKLLPYTPKELMLAHAAKKPLNTQVEAAIANKHVICFLKYYDQFSRGLMVRRYPILKIYTEDEINAYHALNTAPQTIPPTLQLTNVESVDASSSVTPSKLAEKEFFTPTTRAVLEEVISSTSLDATPSDEPIRAKRALEFEDSQPQKTSSSTEPTSHTSIIEHVSETQATL